MIDWNKSADWNTCTVEWLEARVARFPHSRIRVIAVCNQCGLERKVSYYQYRELCHKCANGTPEHCTAMSLSKIQYHKDHPDVGRQCSKRLVQYHIDHPEAGKKHSEVLKNSDAMKAEHKRQRGGNDMVYHHVIYDYAESTKYTVPITRTEHSRLHRLLEARDIQIPHINIQKVPA